LGFAREFTTLGGLLRWQFSGMHRQTRESLDNWVIEGCQRDPLTVRQLDGFGDQVTVQQDLNGQDGCTRTARSRRQLSSCVGHADCTQALGHTTEQKSSEDWRIRAGLGAAIQQDVG